ncbi:hypothetical protein RM844_20590 [Streptomyces sp. DSM 44915]|uniref:DUF4352 domain-containing protein n=1 Tax=Streptomyces chisholmiae TaxID=3075540 RepID=A0ABU2JWT7_9ACTN|nr:hypothetical protein [Streptomyces sp. DSM 44915]MDT0268688.1 hypothetical protein [Streptomyces sp. DSM 44915]
MKRTRTLLLTAATATALALTGCGGDDGADDAQPRPSADGGTEDALRQAVQANLDAINAGDAEAVFASRSASCQEDVTVAEAAAAVELIDALYGEITFESLDVLEFDGTTARVHGTTGIEALDEANGTEGARWIWEDGAWRDDSCAEEVGAVPDDPPAAPSDLAAGDTHAWADGTSLTIEGSTEIPLDSLGEFDTVAEGHTPFWVAMTIVNDGEQPIDLGEFGLVVTGATNGGTVDSVYLTDQEFLEGRLAPGETKEYREAYSIDTEANGRDVVIEAWRYTDDMTLDAPTWITTIQ